MTYSSCRLDGDCFTALVSTTRHSEGHATVFGKDDLTLHLRGTCIDKIARYAATADEVPGVVLEGLLVLSEQPQRAQEASLMANTTTHTFRPDRPPKPPARGR